MIRQPVVAGAFYPRDPAELRRQVDGMIPGDAAPVNALGLVCPHAGYIYSGSCAGRAYGGVEFRDTVVILGVNHHGLGAPLAVDGHLGWRTPLGDVAVDRELAERLAAEVPQFRLDSRAGSREHSLEVQVPFIQVKAPRAAILPVIVGAVAPDTLVESGRALARVVLDRRPGAVFVASTDMSHYISAAAAARKDRVAIERILAMDPEGLLARVAGEGISMCGAGPTAMLLAAAREAGAEKVEEVCYTHSGAVTGDEDQVVAYWSGRILA